MDCSGADALLAFGVQGEVNHHDGVFLDNADEQDDADEGDQGEFDVEEHQGQQGADAGGGQAGKNGDGMNVAFVEDAQNNIYDNDGGQDEERLGVEGGAKFGRAAGETGGDGVGQADFLFRGGDGLDRGVQGTVRAQVEGEGDGRELALVQDDQRGWSWSGPRRKRPGEPSGRWWI